MIRTIGGFGDSRSMVQKTLDLRGLKCPLPALYTRKALAGLAPGDVLFVACTDPLAGIDIPNLVRETGDVLEDTRREAKRRRSASAKRRRPSESRSDGE